MPNLIQKPSGTDEQCIDYILRHNHGEYTPWDVKSIVTQYFGYASDIDPVKLVAQMVHETGNLTSWWSQRPRRNPAGIGVTGRVYNNIGSMPGGHWAANPDGTWHEGNSYLNWMQSVRCHVGRVLCYRFTAGGGNAGQRELMTEATKDRLFPPQHRGRYTKWEDLNGIWAVPGNYYAETILNIAKDIIK